MAISLVWSRRLVMAVILAAAFAFTPFVPVSKAGDSDIVVLPLPR